MSFRNQPAVFDPKFIPEMLFFQLQLNEAVENRILGLLEASVAVITQLKPADKPQFLGKKPKADELQALLFFKSDFIWMLLAQNQHKTFTKAPKTAREEQELQKAA